MRASSRFAHRRRGFSLIEVIVAVMILLVGVVGIVQLFPPSLRVSSEAALKGRAALLAQQKLAELRRDDDSMRTILTTIAGLGTDETPPVSFADDDRLVYQFSARSAIDPENTSNETQFAPDVPRIVVRFNQAFRADRGVLYELRFDG